MKDRAAGKKDDVMSGAMPRPVGTPPKEVTLDGALLAFTGDEPVMINVHGSDAIHLPCFSDEENLLRFMVSTLEESEVVHSKAISDQDEFLSSLPKEVIVILDPEFEPDGRVRYTEILR